MSDIPHPDQAEFDDKLLRLLNAVLDLSLKTADTALKEAQRERVRQELRLAPWQLVLGSFAAGAGLFAGLFALLKLWLG